MTTRLDTLSTSNKKITEFYLKNPHINFESINCSIVDFLNNIITELPELKNNNLTHINDKLLDFLKTNKNTNSSLSDDYHFSYILNKIFPSSSTDYTSTPLNFTLTRNNMPNILFDCKQYTYNVPIDEVNNFIKKCNDNNTSGILISNTSGIATKNNFHIDISDKNILLYLHNTNYNENIIHTAVDILDYLANVISNIDPSCINPLTSAQLTDINQEFQTFLHKKESVINYIRDTNKKLLQQILDIELPSLHTYLSSKFNSIKALDFTCNICHNFTGKNNKSLASHKKACNPLSQSNTDITKSSVPRITKIK